MRLEPAKRQGVDGNTARQGHVFPPVDDRYYMCRNSTMRVFAHFVNGRTFQESRFIYNYIGKFVHSLNVHSGFIRRLEESMGRNLVC